jgi:hypothetical protein
MGESIQRIINKIDFVGISLVECIAEEKKVLKNLGLNNPKNI